MESFNVVVTVSTTVCIDAENPDDAIEKVSQALNNGDANMSADVASNISARVRDNPILCLQGQFYGRCFACLRGV